jgi:hypothetical protein
VSADDPTGGADEPLAYRTATVRSRDGGIAVTTTELGLPLALTVAPDQLHRDPADLAAELRTLCRLAAGRAGLARRAALAEAGVAEHALALLGLPTADAVAAAEAQWEADSPQPRSWLEAPDE